MLRRRREPVYDDRRAARAVLWLTSRRAGRGGALWGLLFGSLIASAAYSYVKAFPTEASRQILALSFQGNRAFEALFGPIHGIGTVPGYTNYKTLTTLVILGAIWGLLTATRHLRGDEDNGRWELLLSGRTTRAGATRQVAAGLGVGLVALWVPTAVLTLAVGSTREVGFAATSSLFFATTAIAAAAMFMAIGMLVSQLAPTRRDANLIGGGVLAGSYLIRMVADSSPALEGLRWASPLGWIEELRALTGSNPAPLVPIVLLIGGLVWASVRIAARRDVGSGLLAARDAPRPRMLLLRSQAGLTIRLTRPAIVAWAAALAVTGLALGLVAQAAAEGFRGAPALERAIERLGGTSAGAAAYLGLVFTVAAALVGIAVAGQVAAIRNEEAAGHLENLLVRPVARWRWLGVRIGMGAGLVLVASLAAGVTAWAGAASQGTGIALTRLLEASVNVTPPALFVLGVGALVYGLWPRIAIGAAYGLVVWSFVAEVFSSVSPSADWLRRTSPFLYITPAPAAEPDWVAGAWLVGLGAVAAALGILAFGRRDLAGA